MMRYADTQFGGVDILINNAGIQHVAPVEAFPVEKWNDIIAINLSSVFHTSRLALPAMREKNWGRIINIASVHGLVASKEKSAYVAAKHGVVGFTKSPRWRLPAPVLLLTPSARDGCLRRWFSSRSTNVSQKVCLRIGLASSCLRRNSHQESLLRQNSWVNWRCFYVVTAPCTCGARRGIWTAGGSPSDVSAGQACASRP